MTARPAASAVRLSADKLLVHQALDEHYGARSELETAAADGEGSSVIQSVHRYLTEFPGGEPAGDGS
jgi:hypothetical protein